MGDNLTMTTINKQISLRTDDGYEINDATLSTNGTTAVAGYTSGAVCDIGLRWQAVNIPQAATINSATLSAYLTTDVGTLSANIRGMDEDDTATWSSGSRPSQRTKTTATITANEVNWGNWGVGNWVTIDIASVVQEIINRAGWGANNDLAVVIEDTAGTGENKINIRTYDYSGNLHGAKLDIDYTAAGGTSIPVLVHQYQQQGIS